MTDYRSNMEKARDLYGDIMVEFGVATYEEIGLAVALCGNTLDTMQNVLYIRTGCRTLEQFMDEDE